MCSVMVQLCQGRGNMSGDVGPQSDQVKVPGLGMDKERSKFTSDLIRAIEELEQKRLTRSPQQLADAAWQKLQYDFPVIDTRELQALLEAFRSSFIGKAGWPCYMLTHKALENISEGAQGAGSHAPPLTQQEQQVQSVLLDSLSQRLSKSSTGSTAQHLQQEGISQQQVFQQLAAVLLLQYAAKVAALPEQEAWHLLQAYCPEQPCSSSDYEQQQQQQQQQQLLHAAQAGIPWQPQLQEDACMRVTAGLVNGSLVESANATYSQAYHDTVADEQDSDGDAYEPLQEIAPQQQHYSGNCNSLPQPHQLDPGPCSWPALRHKLLSLSEYVHYSAISCDQVWQQQGAAQHLLQVLRLLGVHSRSQELQPLLHAYVSLLVDRLAAAPQDLGLLHQLWEALGLTLASGLKDTRHGAQQGFRTARSQGQAAGLHPEAALGLSVCAAVWQQLPTISARKQLWQTMHEHLVPLLESCAEQLAYSSSSSSRTGKSPEHMSPGGACGTSVAFAHTLLLSHVVELLVLGRPAHVDVGKQLTDMGVTRSLVQLHMQWGCEQAAEPLRRALLLMCSSAPSTCSWVLAVPGVKQQLQQGHFSPGGPFEAHAALWQLLISNCSSNSQRLKASSTPTAVPADRVCEAASEQLLAVLCLPSSGLQHLQRQVVLLQVMADAQRATCGKQCLWSSQVLAALRKLAAQLKESGTSTSTKPEHGEASIPRPVVCSDSDSDDGRRPVLEADSAGDGQHRKQRQHPDAQQLQHRRAAQLQPAALSCIKELLTLGGSKKD